MEEKRRVRKYSLERTAEDSPASSDSAYLGELNEQQRAAVTAPDGPVLVLAGAGSGKTRVITYRVAHLIGQRRIAPQNILLMTFTNKAAREMLGRCQEVIGGSATKVTGGTFHHCANLLLRRHCRVLGYESNFTILDASDAQRVMKNCRSEAGVERGDKAFPSAKLLYNIASSMVNTHSDLESLLARRWPHLLEMHDEVQRVLIAYHERKRISNQMDFDDLLVNFLKLLTEQPAVRDQLCARYLHVLVDEYQDVNHLQARIVEALYRGGAKLPQGVPAKTDTDDDDGFGVAAPIPADQQIGSALSASEAAGGDDSIGMRGRGLFVVGDDAQSIYSFRGADYMKIRSFPDSFPGAHVYKLEVNYRSAPQILSLANALLDEADPTFRKELRPVKPEAAERPMLLACSDANEQAEFICEQLIKLREDGVDYDGMAVLYRAHSNRMEVELELTKRGVPFVVRGGLRFFEQAHIKDLLSYIVVLANSRDELAWSRMLEMQQRVGPKTVAKVLQKLRGTSDEDGGPLSRFTNNGVADSIGGQGGKSLKDLRDYLRGIESKAGNVPLPDLLREVFEEQYRPYMELQYENWRDRVDDIEQLIVFANRFNSLEAFLSDIGLHGSFQGARINEQDDHDWEEGAVTLSTIHQAKGLEWQAVFVIHVEDNVIPHRMSAGTDSEDEERRLLYVAVTRAEEMLYMSFPQLTLARDFQRIINHPSRFLTGLPADAYDEAVLDWGSASDWG